MSTLKKIKIPKGGFHSDAIEETFVVSQKTSQHFLKEPFFS